MGIAFNLVVNVIANVNNNSNANNNNINMNMNTGRFLENFSSSLDTNNFWNFDNLADLIDKNISNCDGVDVRDNFMDTESLRKEYGGSFKHSSCVALNKLSMMILSSSL